MMCLCVSIVSCECMCLCVSVVSCEDDVVSGMFGVCQ